MIVYNLLPDGGFVCGDTETRATSYAYPSSDHADKAKKSPAKVAIEMVAQANEWLATHDICSTTASYNLRNWKELDKAALCKLHNYEHFYTVHSCGHQYCPQTWKACPRCFDAAEVVEDSDICEECGVDHGSNGCELIRELVGDEG